MKPLLLFFSLVYRSGCQFKNWLYSLKIFKPKREAIPTISIGNITFGGSEKTPIAMNLISYLTVKGYKPAFVSRGYKGRWERHGGILSDGSKIYSTWKDSGDEPFLVAQNFPHVGVFVGKNRLASCKIAREMGFTVAVLDDCFQHRRLSRDLDIVVYDPAERTALREPVSSLKRAHILLIKDGMDEKSKKKIKEKFQPVPFYEYSVSAKGFFRLGKEESVYSPFFEERKVLAFCGIARPERFLSSLAKESIEPAHFLKFPDHHSYPLSSLRKIAAKYQKSRADAVVTTEKDAVKIAGAEELKNIPVFYMKIDIQIEENFYKRIFSSLQKKSELSNGK